jgi:hypothetical protein
MLEFITRPARAAQQVIDERRGGGVEHEPVIRDR